MGGSLVWALPVMVCAQSLLGPMTAKSLPASLGLGLCGLPFRKGFYSGMLAPQGGGVRCLEQK